MPTTTKLADVVWELMYEYEFNITLLNYVICILQKI